MSASRKKIWTLSLPNGGGTMEDTRWFSRITKFPNSWRKSVISQETPQGANKTTCQSPTMAPTSSLPDTNAMRYVAKTVQHIANHTHFTATCMCHRLSAEETLLYVPVRFPLALLFDACRRIVCDPTQVPEHLSSERRVESQRDSND